MGRILRGLHRKSILRHTSSPIPKVEYTRKSSRIYHLRKSFETSSLLYTLHSHGRTLHLKSRGLERGYERGGKYCFKVNCTIDTKYTWSNRPLWGQEKDLRLVQCRSYCPSLLPTHKFSLPSDQRRLPLLRMTQNKVREVVRKIGCEAGKSNEPPSTPFPGGQECWPVCCRK